jgi:DNA-binding transcriptional regulator LsrR (DeoR family)
LGAGQFVGRRRVSQTQIAMRLGINRRAVKRLLEAGELPR